jgi:hypothetical protein
MRVSQSRLQILASIPIFFLLWVTAEPFVTPYINYSINYKSVPGKVVGNGLLCRAYGKTPEVQAEFDKIPELAQGNWHACDNGDTQYTSPALNRYSQMQLIDGDREDTLTLVYTSPVDGSERIATLPKRYGMDGRKDGEVGQTMKIAAHNRDPNRVAWPTS